MSHVKYAQGLYSQRSSVSAQLWSPNQLHCASLSTLDFLPVLTAAFWRVRVGGRGWGKTLQWEREDNFN